MEFISSPEKLVLIYEASSALTPVLCNFILRESESKKYTIRFHFLETTKEKYAVAESHGEIVRNSRSRLLIRVLVTRNPKVAFRNIDYAIVMPSKLFDPGVEPPEIYDVQLFVYIGRALDQYAKKSVQVIIFGHKSVNILCSVCSQHCPSINPSQITGVSCHHEIRAKKVISEKMGPSSSRIKEEIQNKQTNLVSENTRGSHHSQFQTINHSPPFKNGESHSSRTNDPFTNIHFDRIRFSRSRIKDVYVWGTDWVDVQHASIEDKKDPLTDVQDKSCAVHTIHFDDDSAFSELSSHSSLPKQVLQSMHPSTTQLQNSIGDFTEDSWNQECDSIPGFHCTDIIPVENIYDCYSYDLWDIECPEVKYKSKYCSPHLPHEGTEEKAVKQKNRCNEKNDEEDSMESSAIGDNSKNLSEVIQDDTWIITDLVAKTKELDLTADLTTVSFAIARHFNHLVYGSVEPLSMVVCSDGSYGVHKSVFFSFPVKVVDGEVAIVRDICMSSRTQRYIHTKSASLMRFGEKLAVLKSSTLKENLEKLMSSFTEDEENEDDDLSSTSSKYTYFS